MFRFQAFVYAASQSGTVFLHSRLISQSFQIHFIITVESWLLCPYDLFCFSPANTFVVCTIQLVYNYIMSHVSLINICTWLFLSQMQFLNGRDVISYCPSLLKGVQLSVSQTSTNQALMYHLKHNYWDFLALSG